MPRKKQNLQEPPIEIQEEEPKKGILFKLFDRLEEIFNFSKDNNNVSSRAVVFRVVRIFLTLLILVIALKIVVDKNTKVNSLQGFINSQLITVNSPIKGVVELNQNLVIGRYYKSKTFLARIQNDHEDYLSDLEIRARELESRLKANKEHYDNILAIINSRNGLLSEYSGKSFQQTKLRIKYEKDKSNEFKNDLVESKKALELSEKQFERMTVLIKDGFVSQADLDKAKATFEQNQAVYQAKKAKVDQSQSQIRAAEKGLQVDGSQAVSFQEARRKDLEIELLNLSQQAAEAKLQVDLTQSELEKTNEHLKKEREAKVFMPIDGVIWSIPAKSGENIIAGQPVIKVINCNDRWIEAFVTESDIGKVHIGSPVKVRSLSADKKVWNGYIQSIRGGTNRVKVGEDVDILPPELVRRQMTLRIAVDWEREGNELIEKIDRASKFSEFCQVGNSVEVTFVKQRN